MVAKFTLLSLIAIAGFSVNGIAQPVLAVEIGESVPPIDSNDTSYASISVYKELLVYLIEEYDLTVRPRLKQWNTVEVNTSFALDSVVHFDTTGQRIDVMGYFIVTWFDELLQWIPEEFERTSYVKLPLDRIWYPKLVISKSYDGSKFIGDAKNDIAKITYKGLVTWVPDGIYSSTCDVSVAYYPFDVQTCELIYYVSDEVIQTVNLSGPDDIPLQDYIENSEWRLVEVSTSIKERYTTNFVHITFKIERRAIFTTYTMIVPLVALSMINIFTFLIPVDSGEKGSLAITLFLAYGFFVTITRDALPHNSTETSYYIIYITVLLVLSLFTVIYVIIESKLHSGYGTIPFKLTCTKTNSVVSLQRPQPLPGVDGVGHGSEPDNDQEKRMTWADMLKAMDVVMFIPSFVVIFVFSTVLWATVITKN